MIQSLFTTNMCFFIQLHVLFPIKKTKAPSSNKRLTQSQFVCPQSRNHPGVAEKKHIQLTVHTVDEQNPTLNRFGMVEK